MENFSIKGFLPNSLVDWDGKVAAVLFLGECNFRCGFCHNKDLVLDYKKMEDVDFDVVKGYLKRNENLIDGVVITGGEPCMHSYLKSLIRKIKAMKLLIKLDTNGSYPEVLKDLIENRLVDYVAMDIKYKADKYGKFKNNVLKSIKLIIESGIDSEFRTTVIPNVVCREDLTDIAKLIRGGKRYYLQQFKNENCLDKEFEKIEPFSKEKLEEFSRKCSMFIRTSVRC